MCNVVYTKSLENADDIIVKIYECTDKAAAIKLFNKLVQEKLNEALDNEFLKVKMSMHKHKALITFESTHHVISITEKDGVVYV